MITCIAKHKIFAAKFHFCYRTAIRLIRDTYAFVPVIYNPAGRFRYYWKRAKLAKNFEAQIYEFLLCELLM